MATTPVRPVTRTGVGELALPGTALLPSMKEVLEPQHFTVPAAVNAQLCSKPVTTATALVRPTTVTGVSDWVRVPSPSSPEPLKPQHFTLAVASSAQVWNSAALMASALV